MGIQSHHEQPFAEDCSPSDGIFPTSESSVHAASDWRDREPAADNPESHHQASNSSRMPIIVHFLSHKNQ